MITDFKKNWAGRCGNHGDNWALLRKSRWLPVVETFTLELFPPELNNDQPEKPHQCISPVLLPNNVIAQGQLLPQVTNCISDVWIQYCGERKWWIWGRTSQDFPRTTESLFNETCSAGSWESPDSARLYILMLFCTDVLICLPPCVQVKTTHVCALLFFLPSSIKLKMLVPMHQPLRKSGEIYRRHIDIGHRLHIRLVDLSSKKSQTP